LTGPGDLRVPETGPFRKRSRSRFLVLRNVRFYLSANISRGLGPPGQCTQARHAAPWLGAASRLAPAAARGARDGAPRGRGMRSKNRGRSGPAGVLARLATRTSGEWRPPARGRAPARGPLRRRGGGPGRLQSLRASSRHLCLRGASPRLLVQEQRCGRPAPARVVVRAARVPDVCAQRRLG